MYRVTDNNVKLTIPTNPLTGIEVNYDNNIVRILPTKSLSNSKVTTTVANNAVTYKDYYGKGIDLRYTPLLSGVKEDIILNSYTQQEYSFTLDTKGLKVYEKEGKYYLAKDEKSESVYDIGEVLVYDAVGRPTYGDMKITCIEEGNKYNIIITVSDEYLKDEITVYPVTIDPTLTVSDTVTGDGSIQDVPIFEGRPLSNHGNFIYLSPGYVDSTYKVGRVLVRTPGLYNSTAYQNATMGDIQSVKFCCKDGSGNAASYVNLYPITSNVSWGENGVVWNVSYNIYNSSRNWGTTVSYGGVTEFDITTLVKCWKNGTYNKEAGFMLINSNETSAAYRKAIFSSEYGVTTDRPYIEMTYATILEINSSRRMVAIGSEHQLTCNIDENSTGIDINDLSWSSSNTSKATVNNSGVVTGVAEGSAIITASYIDEVTGLTVADSILIKVVDQSGVKAEEEYIIYNKLSPKMLTLAASSNGNPSVTDFTDVVTRHNDDVKNTTWLNACTWKLVNEGYGLFSIQNVYASGQRSQAMCLDVSTYGLDLYRNDGGGYLKFNICRENDGGLINLSTLLETTEPTELKNYKTGLYLITYNNMYLTADTSGNISMTTAITDGSYWSFSVAGDKNVKMDYTETEGNINTKYIINYLKGEIDSTNYYQLVFGSSMPNTGVAYKNSSATTIINHMKESNFYMYRGHGMAGGLINKDDIDGNQDTETISYLLANDGMPDIITADEDGDNISDTFDTSLKSRVYINQQDSNVFASNGIVLIIGCSTGTDFVYDHDGNASTPSINYNLLEEIYNKGAHLVIGTTDTMITTGSERFAENLFSILKNQSGRNQTIKECLKETMQYTTSAGNSHLSNRFVVIGDINQWFEYGELE